VQPSPAGGLGHLVDGRTNGNLQLLVVVAIPPAQPPSQRLTDGCLPAAHHAEQEHPSRPGHVVGPV
jgi:hypothetical protein